MFYSKQDNPFEEQLLPKAFYFPSLEKDLSTNERKICLSPDKLKGHPKEMQRKQDAKFLRGSNKLSAHEIPTREDGTVKHDTSSGSQFDESWPSTDKNVSSLLTQHTPSSSTPAEVESSQTQKYPHQKTSSNPSTLSKYIERFRHGVPASREQRRSVLSTNGKDFWWLSPPSSSSTPKEPAESTISSKISPSSTSDTSPKLSKKLPYKKSAPKSWRGRSKRPLRELVETADSETDKLQTRADILIERSENTFSDISTPESLPKRPSSWMLEKHKRQSVKDETKIAVTRPRLAPEDDILYQWRLARRLEKAQEQAKSGWVKGFPETACHHGIGAAHHSRSSHHMEGEHKPGLNIRTEISEECESGTKKGTMTKNRETKYDLPSRTIIEKGDISTLEYPRLNRSILKKAEDEPVKSCRIDSVAVHKRKSCVDRAKLLEGDNATQNVPILSDVPGVCFIRDLDLPPHVHMMCDILPCCSQHQEHPDLEGNTTTVMKEHLRIPASTVTSENYGNLPPRTTEQLSSSTLISRNDREQVVSEATFPVVHKFGSPSTQPPETSRETNQESGPPRTPKQDDIRMSEENHRRMSEKNLEKPNFANGNMIDNVIGQVISERLFSSLSSSRRSSGSDLTNECEENEKQKTKLCEKEQDVNSESKACDGHDEPPHSTEVDDPLEFPDDEILIRLRQQADVYQEHLRNIDRLLEQVTE